MFLSIVTAYFVSVIKKFENSTLIVNNYCCNNFINKVLKLLDAQFKILINYERIIMVN